MGFGREARRAADPQLPVRYRLHALGSCVQLAQPIGFHATWRYLELRTGVPWREPDFLAPALQLLLREREAHLELADEYSEARRRQKQAGYRFPPAQDTTPVTPRRWHGDEETGALVTLRTVLELDRFDESELAAGPAHLTLEAVRQAVDGNRSKLDPSDLQSSLDWCRRQIHVIGWEADRESYRAAGQSLRLLGQLHLILHGAVPIATPWNFVAPPSG